jgi:hypothetical protein
LTVGTCAVVNGRSEDTIFKRAGEKRHEDVILHAHANPKRVK